MMKEIKRPHSAQKTLRVTCLVLADLILINLSAFLALYIRFEFDLGQLRATAFLHDMLVYAGINTVCTIVIFRILNLYNSLWEFASVPELLRIAMGCLLSSVTYMVGMFMLQLAMPRSFPVMYMLILCLLCGSLRFAYRGVGRTRAGLRSRGEKRTMLIGGGVKIVLNYNLVALPSVNIHGAPIGTLVCFALTALLNLIAVARIAPFRLNYPGYFLRPLFASLVMAFAARGVYALAAHFLIPSVEEAGRLTLLLCVGLAIGVAVVIYGVLVLALHCIRRSDLELLPKGDKLARLLHIS